jgi:hypothetical protein
MITYYSKVFPGLLVLVALFGPLLSYAEEAHTYPEISEIGLGRYQFGDILIDQNNREFLFPGICNQISGLVEYALVHEDGKVHESLFRTKVRPRFVHACFLLLKEKPETRFFKILDGNVSEWTNLRKIELSIIWEQNNTYQEKPLSSMVINQTDNRELASKSFVFSGSSTIEGQYLAEMDGSIIAVYHDSRAVLNSMDKHSNSDEVWIAHQIAMPPKGHPVRIRLKLPKKE